MTWWVEGPLVTILTLILLYYGGRSGPNGDSSYIDHGLWQDAIFWPVVIIGFVLLVIDRTGHKRPPGSERVPVRSLPKAERRAERIRRHQQARRVSSGIARKIIARQERRKVAYLPSPAGEVSNDG